MSDELKTCPFCGGEASSFEDSGHSTAWEIGCFNGQCSAEPHVWEKTKAEAIAAWNTRAARIEELEAKLVTQQHTLDSTEAMAKEYLYRAITAEANSDKAFALEDALKLEPIRNALAILQQMAFELNRELFREPPDAEPEMREMLAKINSAFADLHVRKQ